MRLSKSLVIVVFSSWLCACGTVAPKPALDSEIPLAVAQLALPSGTVEYLDTGGPGVPVLLLHPINIRLWQYQIAALAKAGYRVIAIDSRNHAAGAPYETPASSQLAVRIDELVSKFGLPKFHVVGTLANGPLAMRYAMAHPDKVRSVNLCATLGGLTDPEVNAIELSLRPAPFNDMPPTFREISATYRVANPEGTKRWLQLTNEGRAAVTQAPPGPPSPPPANNFVVTLAKLDAWQLPTMLMVGDAELFTPPSMMRLFVSHLQSGEGAVIPEAGHAPFWENPAEFNRLLLGFIRKH